MFRRSFHAARLINQQSLRSLTVNRSLHSSKRVNVQDNPAKVTTTSTTVPITTGEHANTRAPIMPPEKPGPSQLLEEIKGVAKTVEGVPRPALIVGLAGTLPYLGSSLASLYLSWDISRYNGEMTGALSEKFLLFSPDKAEMYLHALQPIQIGYGACILSFLGAIHWGLEIAGFGGHLGVKRYLYGAVPALIAWPSILLPIDFALISHFICFTGVWFADAAATKNGFAPGWYNQYRFLLTFIVCSSILFTLIVSGWLGDPMTRSANSSRLENLRNEQKKMLGEDLKASAKTVEKKRQTDEQEDLNVKAKEHQENDKKPQKKPADKAKKSTGAEGDAEKSNAEKPGAEKSGASASNASSEGSEDKADGANEEAKGDNEEKKEDK